MAIPTTHVVSQTGPSRIRPVHFDVQYKELSINSQILLGHKYMYSIYLYMYVYYIYIQYLHIHIYLKEFTEGYGPGRAPTSISHLRQQMPLTATQLEPKGHRISAALN